MNFATNLSRTRSSRVALMSADLKQETGGDTIYPKGTSCEAREYLWLGLTPITVIAANDNVPRGSNETQHCAHQTKIGELEVRNTELAAQVVANQTRISELEASNIALADQIVTNQTNITTRQARITTLQTQITTHQTELDTLQAQCDAAGGGTGTGGSGEATLSYLHTDHLGKPQFATDTTGTVIWDAGGQVTPFGDGINLAAAFTQNLQFPGQYADTETGLSHNHHRTYDPALGRYLQSDPIGLAGGLNLFAYVGGNPMGFVDPQGLDYWGIPGKVFEDYGYWERVVFVHFNRNALQTSSDVPCLQDDLSGFSEMEQNSYHIQGIGGAGNTKWVKGNFEAVYDTNGRLVTDPVNRGTYNISPFRDDVPSGARHFRDDMLFYYILGNSPNDPTNYYERVTASYKGTLPKTSSCGCNSYVGNVMSQLRGLSKP